MPASNAALTWLAWGCGGGFAGLGAAVAWLFQRNAAEEDRVDTAIASAREGAASGDRELWVGLRALEDRFQAHRGDVLAKMVTKGDLHSMEGRIMAALRDHQVKRHE